MVTHGKSLDTFADLDNDACPFVAAEHGKRCHRNVAADHMVVGMAQPRGFQLNLDLAFARLTDNDLLNRPWLIEVPDQSAFCLHLPASCVRLHLQCNAFHA